jgi:hypothetical protein
MPSWRLYACWRGMLLGKLLNALVQSNLHARKLFPLTTEN